MALSKTVKIAAVAAGVLIILAVGLGVGLGVGQKKEGIWLEFQPKPTGSNMDSTLIYYRANDKGSVQKWVAVIDDFLQEYRGRGAGEKPGVENRVACSNNFHAQPNQVCDFDVESIGPCTRENNYNYDKGGPCVFLKLSKILNWTPDLYNSTESLPAKMPIELKEYVGRPNKKEGNNLVWVSCEGESPADMENIGPIEYMPRRGFPAYYYPFTNVEGYLSPLVAVLFEKPTTGVLINIECKAWARNILYGGYERRGSVHFELMVDIN